MDAVDEIMDDDDNFDAEQETEEGLALTRMMKRSIMPRRHQPALAIQKVLRSDHPAGMPVWWRQI